MGGYMEYGIVKSNQCYFLYDGSVRIFRTQKF